MYVKVFRQIFDSSVAENYQTRWVFQDLLILADKTGVVDMTITAISRTTGVPREIVAEAVKELEQPDSHSRNPDHEGRRLLRLDDHRDWGWKIANYEDYRDIQDEEARRGMWAQQKREQRRKERLRRMSRTLNGHVKTITDCPQLSANVRLSEAYSNINPSTKDSPKASSKHRRKRLATDDFWKSLEHDPDLKGVDLEEEKRKMRLWHKRPKNQNRQITEQFVLNWLARSDRQLSLSEHSNGSCL